jgi:hypothetical protein
MAYLSPKTSLIAQQQTTDVAIVSKSPKRMRKGLHPLL